MAQFAQLTRPVMRRSACFHACKARRQPLEDRHHMAAPQLLAHHNLVIGVDAVNLEHVLGEIETDRANLHVDGPLIVIRL